MTEMISTKPYVIDDDDGYDSPLPTEDWNEECNQGAALLEHRRKWTKVMTELIQVNKARRPRTLLDRRGRSLLSSCGRCRQCLNNYIL